jgi:signal transduction histidine kinase
MSDATNVDRSARAMLSVAQSVVSDMDVERVLERVLGAAQELTGAQYAAVGVLDESRTSLARFVTAGVNADQRAAIGAFPTGRGVLGEMIRDPSPFRLTDVGAHPRSHGFPAGHPPMHSFLGAPIVIDDEVFGNLYLTEKRGGEPFSQADEDALILLAGFAGVAVDHARRYSGAEEQRQALQRTVETLDATIQISRALGGQTDLTAILELVAQRGRALVSARALIIELERNGELVVAAGAGEIPPGLIGQHVQLDGTIAGEALRTRRSQDLTDRLNRQRFEEHGAGQFGLHADHGLVVPLVFGTQSFGVLIALDRLDAVGPFSLDDQRLLEAFAASAATAVATAQSVAGERQRQRIEAAEIERGRWARELHDETLQGLANLRLLLGAAQRSGSVESMTHAIAEAATQLDLEIANLRALVTELRPAVLDALGVDAALRALSERMTVAGVDVDVSIDLADERDTPPTRLAAELETAVYRIVQHALTNAARHGAATRAVVDVYEDASIVHVTVRDNGCGFDPSTDAQGFGLLGMRERAELLGGTLTINSSPSGGTTILATIPAARRPSASAATAGGAAALSPAPWGA